MKAITLHQPYASLIASGIKTVETRSWRPAGRLELIIGERIAIHAGQEIADYCDPRTYSAIDGILGADWRRSIPRGAIVATARLKDCVQLKSRHIAFDADAKGRIIVVTVKRDGSHLRVNWDPHGDFAQGRWLWILDQVEPLDPVVKARGALGLWEWPSSAEWSSQA